MKNKILIGTGIVLSSLLAFTTIFNEACADQISNNVIAGDALQIEFDKLKVSGKPMSMIEIIPPSIPDSKNAAIELRLAFKLMNKGSDYYKNKDFIAKTIKNISTFSKLKEQNKIKKLLASEEVQKIFSYASKAANKPALNFNLDYSKGMDMPVPHLQKVRGIVRLLCIKASLEARGRKRELAYQTLLTAFKISFLLKDEPVIISQLVLLACDKLVIKCTESIVNNYGISSNDAEMLLAELSKRNLVKDMAKMLSGERLMFMSVFEKIITGNTSKELESVLSIINSLSSKKINYPLSISSKASIKNDYAAYLRLHSRYDKWFTMPFWKIEDRSTKQFIKDIPKSYILTRMLFPALIPIREKVAKAEQKIAKCKVMLALYMYKNKAEKFPASLDNLSPTFLKKVPVSPLSGKNFSYKLKNNNFELK